MSKVIGIIGSRSRCSIGDFTKVHNAFRDIYEIDDWICSGGCPIGADEFAIRLHQDYSAPYLEFPANWDKYGRSAGMRRNTEIAKHSDVLIACVAENRKGGTEDTIRKFVEEFGKNWVILV